MNVYRCWYANCEYTYESPDENTPCPRCGACASTFEVRYEKPNPVAHPPHYTSHKSGIECIQITEHMGFCLGNAVKYIWRADLKGNAVEDLEKATWYLQREIERRKKEGTK